MPASPASRAVRARRWAALCAAAIGGLGWSGCDTESAVRYSPAAVSAMSPAAEIVQPLEAVRLAKRYVAGHPGTDFLVGCGDSMLPLYRDHTVVVTRQAAFSDLRPGMTAVYFREDGRPVAHVLVGRAPGGWVAQGVGNPRCDDELVTVANLMGVVVKAYEPSSSPLLALLGEAAEGPSVASTP